MKSGQSNLAKAVLNLYRRWDPHLIHCFFGPQESTPNGIFILYSDDEIVYRSPHCMYLMQLLYNVTYSIHYGLCNK